MPSGDRARFPAHNSTTSRSSRTRGSPADRFRSRSVRNSASTAGRQLAGRDRRKLRPHQPAELPEHLFRRRAGVEHQRELAQRVAPSARFDRIGHRPVVLQRRRPGDLAHVVERDRLLAQRVEQQALDVAAQPLDVGAGALGEQPRRRRIDRGAGRRDAVADPALGVGLILDDAAFDDRRVLRAAACTSGCACRATPATNTSVVCGSGCLSSASSCSSARVAASLSRFGTSSVSACSTMTTRRGAIIGSVRAAATSDATPSASRRRSSCRRRGCARR